MGLMDTGNKDRQETALSNAKMTPKDAELADALEKIAADAAYAADPRQLTAQLASVIAAHLRTPAAAPAAAAAE